MSQPAFYFGTGHTFRCSWAKVVTFSDVTTCAIDRVVFQCDAALEEQIPCTNPCDGELSSFDKSLAAIPDEAALVQTSCSSEGRLGGPIDERSLIHDGPGPVISCGAQLPPPPADLCGCTSAACAAR